MKGQARHALAALGHPLRLTLFRALVVGARGMTAGAMMGGVGTPPATLSFHRKQLARAGLVTQERCGRNFIDRANGARMDGLLGWLAANFRAGTHHADGAAARRIGRTPSTRGGRR